MKVQYTKKLMRNQDGTAYGDKYAITGPKGKSFQELMDNLISNVIGEDRYYGNRDVWDQISIVDGR